MPTLLTINNYYYYRGGAETVFLEHNRLFEAAGWRVVPFAMRHPSNLPSPWSRYFVDEIEMGREYSFAQRVARSAKVVYSFEARGQLGRLIDEVRPDLCHAHNIYHHISPSILGLLHQRGVPTVLTLHDLKIACPAYNMLASDGVCERCRGGRLHNVLTHRCIKGSSVLSAVVFAEAVLHRLIGSYDKVARFVVPSRFYMEKFAEWGFAPERFRHVPNFVDASAYTPSFEPGKRFLYFGRLSREKGVATFLRAAAKAECPVSIAGTGMQLDELRALARDINADVEFLGYLTGSALHSAIASARAVVLPSEWYENAPMSVLEAYALGKPVIAARIGGLTELVRDGETGEGFESGNVDELAAALSRFASMPNAQVAALGRAAREWVQADFSADAYRRRILEVYSELGVAQPHRVGLVDEQRQLSLR